MAPDAQPKWHRLDHHELRATLVALCGYQHSFVTGPAVTRLNVLTKKLRCADCDKVWSKQIIAEREAAKNPTIAQLFKSCEEPSTSIPLTGFPRGDRYANQNGEGL